MDVVTLDVDTWDSGTLVQGYESCIWTERYQDPGEVEIKTYRVDEMRAQIPEGSMIGLRDSTEVMVVENHSVEDDEHGPLDTITGRTFEALPLENRATVIVKVTAGDSNMFTYAADDIWPTDAAKALIESHLTVCDDAANQVVPNTAVENLITSHSGSDMSYENEPGILYDQVLSLLQMENAGIRNQLDGHGNLVMYIYKGFDRTVNQTVRDQVIFSIGAGHVVDPKYLWSIKDYKNVAYVVSDGWQERVYAPGVGTGVSGLNRRILYVDASQIKPGSTDAKKSKQAKALGLAALAKQNQKQFFDGEVTPDSPYVRGVDYNLGDKVTLMAQYGVSQTMLVNEFVRTEDKSGEHAYPTLILPSEL